jgi:hypothetical protein
MTDFYLLNSCSDAELDQLASQRASREFLIYRQRTHGESERVTAALRQPVTEPPPTLAEARATQITFGQQRGRTVGELAATKDGREYLAYLQSWGPDFEEDEIRIAIRVVHAAECSLIDEIK